MIHLSDLIEGERKRVTTFESHEDGTVTQRLFWQYTDGREETIKERTLIQADLDAELQKVFAMNE